MISNQSLLHLCIQFSILILASSLFKRKADIPYEDLQKQFLERIKQLTKFVENSVPKDSPALNISSIQQEFICGHDERQVTAINETTSNINVCCLDRQGGISSCTTPRCLHAELQGRQPFTIGSTRCGGRCGGINNKNWDKKPLLRGVANDNRFFCSGMIDIFESIGCSKTAKKTVQLNGQNGKGSQARFCCSGSCSAYFDCPSTKSTSRTGQACCSTGSREFCDGDQYTKPDYGPEYKPPSSGVPTQPPSTSGGNSQQQQQQEQQQTVIVNCRTTNAELIKSFQETTSILERISNRINTDLGSTDRKIVTDSKSTADENVRKSNASQAEFVRTLASIPNHVFGVINKISQSATRDIGPDIFQIIRAITN